MESELKSQDWNFNSSTGAKNAFLGSSAFKKTCDEGSVRKFENLTFDSCDFQGEFEHRPAISFIGCRFHRCDFAYSDWIRTTFKSCEFLNCSFALAIFEDCEFRDCSWERIGLQGSKTDFIRTFLTKPSDFLAAGFSGLRPDLKDSAEHQSKQAYRLEISKAQVARTLLSSHRDVGDSTTYYESARLHDIQEFNARIAEAIHNSKFSKEKKFLRDKFTIALGYMELGILQAFGSLNNWGASILRPIFLQFVNFLGFSIIYCYFQYYWSISESFQKSFDIVMIAGYTNQSKIEQMTSLRLLENFQLIISIILYTVIFSTLISRNSRIRS